VVVLNESFWTAFAALAGLVFALIAPPVDAIPLAWVGLAGLAYGLEVDLRRGPRATADETRARLGALFEGGGRGLAFGFGANLLLFRFIPRVITKFTPLPFAAGLVALALLALAQGLPWVLVAVVRGALVRSNVPRPVAFALAVYAAMFVPMLFPWTPAGGITPWPAMTQLAEHIGERGVTALIALSAGLFAHAARRLRNRGSLAGALGWLGLAGLIPLAMGLQGRARMRAIDDLRAAAPTASLGLVDAAVPATTRWEASAAPGILATLSRLTTSAEERGAEVTVWPESAYPYVLPRGSRVGPAGEGALVAHGVRGPVLIGAVTRDARGDQYNAALAVRPEGVIASEYDKVHLVWFGEEVPFATELPWLRRTFARGLGMLPGSGAVRADLGRVRAGTLICFEDVIAEAGREAAALSPNLLVNLTNDAWFAGSDEPALHLRLAVMRAIETRRDLVRAVNLGPTSLVAASGRVRDVYDLAIPGSLVVKAALLEIGPTLYVRFGDWPSIALGAVLALVFRLRGRKESGRTKRSERRITA
jgi:apolipoprotein N-acyltransferase